MATAVLDLELTSLPADVELPERYSAALVLVRFRGRPVGKATLPVVDGRIAAPDLAGELISAAGWRLWEVFLADEVELWDGRLPVPEPSVTVAVCSRDRPDDLRACLRALSGLEHEGHEVLVIDNAPSDSATHAVTADFPTVRYVLEQEPGLNRARQRALCESRREVVAFVDDDARPDPGWLGPLLRGFADPLVLCTTGLAMPSELETPAQEQFERLAPFGRGFRPRVFESPPHRAVVGGHAGAGVNMAVRRSVLDLLGGFDEALDAGTPTKSGGDNDLFTRVLARGYRIAYEPDALVWHRHRRTDEELRAAIYGYGVGVFAAWTRALVCDHELGAAVAAFRWFWRNQLRSLGRSLLRRPGAIPLRLQLAELHGCAVGPGAYFRSRRRVAAGRTA